MRTLNEYINEYIEDDIHSVQIENNTSWAHGGPISYNIEQCWRLSDLVDRYINHVIYSEDLDTENLKDVDVSAVNIYEYYFNEWENATDEKKKEIINVHEYDRDLINADSHEYAVYKRDLYSCDYWYYLNGEEVEESEFFEQMDALAPHYYADYMGVNVNQIVR